MRQKPQRSVLIDKTFQIDFRQTEAKNLVGLMWFCNTYNQVRG